MEFRVDGGTNLTGNFYLSFVYRREIYMLNGEGKLVWKKQEEQPDANVRNGFWDFKKHDIHGVTYYSYHDQSYGKDNYGLEGYAPGERVILDENFKEVKRITFEKSDVTGKGDPLDGHDFLMIDLNHYILSGYIRGNVNNIPEYPDGSGVVYSYLQEVKDGEVIWDFSSIDYAELYGMTVTDADENANDFGNGHAPDYVHFNSMRIDDNGNLICSFRHLNAIIALDRTRRDNQILWILSGKGDEFSLTEDQKTSGQHYATIDGSYITAFDNDNKYKKTRIVSYRLDMPNKKWLNFKEHRIDGKFSQACGSVQHLKDEIYVIGWGASLDPESKTLDKECMTVYDFAKGEALMTITLPEDSSDEDFTYRCVYYE